MEYRTLGRTGVKVSPLCLGAMNFGGPTSDTDSIRIIHRALEGGINIIDNADMYNDGNSERITGVAIKGSRRKQVILASKCHFPTSKDINDRGNSRRHIMQAVEASLERLQTDWIDLYQIHRPDFEMPQDETLRALDDLVHQGKVLYIGCSTYPAWMVMEALSISEKYGLARYVTEQPPYNLLDRRIENELVPLAQQYQLGLLTWSPLAQGVLSGRYDSAQQLPSDSRAAQKGGIYAERVTDRGIEVGRKLCEIAEANGMTPTQLALLWVKDQPAVTAPILGPRTLAQLQEALPVLEMSLDPDVAAALDELVPPGSAVVNFHNTSGWLKTKI